MAGNAEDQKKAHLNRPMTTCTDIGDGKRLCITISLQECLKANDQPPQSAPSKSKCSEPCETSKKTGSETGGGSKKGSCGTGGTGGSIQNSSSGPGGTGEGSQSGSCGTGGSGGSSPSAPTKPKCSPSCAAYTNAGSGAGGGSQSGSCGAGGTGGSSQNASSGAGATGGGNQSGSCGGGGTGGSNQNSSSGPGGTGGGSQSGSYGAGGTGGSSQNASSGAGGTGGGNQSGSCGGGGTGGSNQNLSSGPGGTGGGNQSGSCEGGGTGGSNQNVSSGAGGTGGGSQSGSGGTAGPGIGNQGLGWASEGPQAGNQNLSCGTGIRYSGRVCGTGVPRAQTGMGEGYGMYQTGSPCPKRGYHGYSQDQSGMGGGNIGYSCGHDSTGGGHQSYGNAGGGNQGFSCGQGGGGGGNQSYSHGPVRSPVHCGTGVGNQGFSCGSSATGGSNQRFTGGSGGTIGRNERYCCEQGGNESQKTDTYQACCDSGGTGLGMPDYSCPPAVQPEPKKKCFFSGGPPDRGPGFCPKKREIVGGGAGGGTGGSGGACGTHSVCREPGEVRTQQTGYGVHHCGVVVGGTSVDCGTGASGGKPQGCSHINDTSTPDSSPAELGKSILGSSIKLAEHQTMPVSQDQLNPQVPDNNSKPLPPEQTLLNGHSNTFSGDKHETNEPKNNLGSSSEPIVNFSSDQYQTVYPQQASNIIEENKSFKKSQFINDTPSLLEQGLSKLLDLVRSYNKPMERARQEPDIERDHVPGCPFYDDK